MKLSNAYPFCNVTFYQLQSVIVFLYSYEYYYFCIFVFLFFFYTLYRCEFFIDCQNQFSLSIFHYSKYYLCIFPDFSSKTYDCMNFSHSVMTFLFYLQSYHLSFPLPSKNIGKDDKFSPLVTPSIVTYELEKSWWQPLSDLLEQNTSTIDEKV